LTTYFLARTCSIVEGLLRRRGRSVWPVEPTALKVVQALLDPAFHGGFWGERDVAMFHICVQAITHFDAGLTHHTRRDGTAFYSLNCDDRHASA